MERQSPADRARHCGERLAMALKAPHIVVAKGLDPADHDLVTFLDALEANAAGKRQFFLGGIGDLHQVPFEPGAGELGDGGIDLLDRRQEVADPDKLSSARQLLEYRNAGTGRQRAGPELQEFYEPGQRDAPTHRRYAGAEQGQALAAANQKT